MLIIPAIDIKGGNCVRLLQGDPEKETVYSNDPVETARGFEEQGAGMIHIVDLDGAFQGEPVNSNTVIDIAQSVKIPIEIGGGIRTADTIMMYLDAGIERIILGTKILDNGLTGYVDKFRENLVAAVDARDSMVATHGWKKVSTVKAIDIINDIWNMGIFELIYTDISTDGMLSGPNIKAMEKILKQIPGINLIASGGVSCMEDIKNLSRLENCGLKGCIVGKAIYDGRINLGEAISEMSKW